MTTQDVHGTTSPPTDVPSMIMMDVMGDIAYRHTGLGVSSSSPIGSVMYYVYLLSSLRFSETSALIRT